MRDFGNKGLGKLVVMFLMLGLFLGLGSTMPAVAAEISVTVTGDGVTTPTTFTQTELEAMTQLQANYSSINTWPTKKWYVAEGVKLADLLTAAGIKNEATLIKVKSTDGYNLTFTRKELVDDPRYYFPGLKDNAEYDGSVPGSPDGATQVDTILALKSSGSDNFDNMTGSDAPLLIMGQRWVTEQTNNAFVKYVGTIEVSTATPEKWANPIADPAEGIVAAGTGVIFNPVNINDMDGANFHYTTDGSDPTFESLMYNWIKYRWWGSRAADLETINHPVDVNHSITIKAVAIGFGRDDSDIVIFNYRVPLLINTANPVNATENKVYAGHTFTAAGGAEPYSFAVTNGVLPAGMELSGAVLEGTPTASGTFVFTVNVTDCANPAETDSHEFTLVVDEAGAAAPPALTADTSDNRIGQAIDITFTDDAAWRAAVSGIKADDTALSSEQYTVTEGNIHIIANVFTAAGDYVVTVQAVGYSDAVVTQTIEAAEEFTVVNSVLTAYQGAGGDVIIPDNLGITAIGDAVFQNLAGLTSVTIPESVTSIGASAFRGCSNLSLVTFPGSVTSIGGSAFRDCTSLPSVIIPESVTSIGASAFRGCSNLSSVIISEGVTSIGSYAFSECSITSITIPGSVTSIASRTFNGCSSLSSVIISEGVAGIETYVFWNCSSLASVTIPDSVTSIGGSAFGRCSSLVSVTIPGSVTSLGDGVFSGCSSLTAITIPASLTSLATGLFKDCISLPSVIIPESVTSIGGSAFYGCSSLTSISIPDSVTSIEGSAFRGCSNLTSINIPSSITRISDNVFQDCTSLSSLTIPDSVTDFGFYAFSNCTSLSSLTIPGGVTSIRNGVFSGCSSLASITIPDSVTSIGSEAFLNCSNLTIYGYAGSYAETYAASNSIPFVAIDGASAPALTADTTDNTVGQAVDITFTDDADWRAAITEVSVDGTDLADGKYAVSAGKIAIAADVFAEAKDYAIVVKATGYQDVTVTQTMQTAPPHPVYTVSSGADTAYTAGTTQDGINTMTVNAGAAGFKYFMVSITPVIAHSGNETVVFAHFRNSGQLGLNATRADFDQVNMAQAGFNVQPGDMIKAYIVDDLTNAIDFNPTILQ